VAVSGHDATLNSEQLAHHVRGRNSEQNAADAIARTSPSIENSHPLWYAAARPAAESEFRVELSPAAERQPARHLSLP
jgi:hypothetical protein